LSWKETRVHDERVKFILEIEAGEQSLAAICRGYGISRKTGYKWLERYQEAGVAGLADRSRAPHRRANAMSSAVEQAVLALRAERPYWGERKLRAYLEREHPQQSRPASSTIGELLKRHGLTCPPKRRRRATPSATLNDAVVSNEVWAIDFKGHFFTRDGKRCDPLTISDTASRYLLRCQAVARTNFEHVRPLLEATFREYGLPAAMRSDNGPPFASTALGGLSRMSVWLLHLGVMPERIEPGHPEQNGRHERMHRTLKRETASPPRATARAQQRSFDAFRSEYNEERPHEALAMQTPASVYSRSPREYPARLPEIEYPLGYEVRLVQRHGDVYFGNRRIFLSEAPAGERVGFEEEEDGWRVWFGPVEPAWLDRKRLAQPRPKGLPRGAKQRVKARFLRRVSGRPSGSLRRASKTQSEETSQKQPPPGTT